MAPQKKKWKMKKTYEEENNNKTVGKLKSSGSENSSWASGHLFHGYSVHVIVFLVLTTRLGLSTDKTSWWFVHPDESYQAVEVAHSEVYGYGFRSFEYFPEMENSTDVQYQLHKSIGMTGTKSWLPVRFYAFFLGLKETLHIPISPFQIIKTLHISVAGLLPMSTFVLVRNMETSFPNDVASIAAIIIGFTDYFVLVGTHTFLESLASPVIFLGLACFYVGKSRSATDRNFNELNQVPKPSRLTPIASGLLLGLSLWLKPDSAIIIASTLLFFLPRILDVKLLSFTFGFVLSCTICCWEEYLTYGTCLSSPVRWWVFRIHESHKVFGSQDADFYFNYVLNTPTLLVQIACAGFTVVMAVFLYTTKFGVQFEDCKKTINLSLGLTGAFIISVLTLSYFPHKDVRFLHDSLVLLACSSACSIFVLFRFLRTLLMEEKQEKLVIALKLFVYAEALMCVVRSSAGYPSAKNRIIRDPFLVPADFWESSEVSACLDFVHRQTDVNGLVLDFSVHRASGFTGFNKNISLLAKTFQDFREWKPESRRVSKSLPSLVAFPLKFGDVTIHSFDDVTNFYAEENGLMVLKHVIENPIYNYAVLTNNRKFPQVGFKQVYRAGNTTLFKRIKSKRADKDLRQISEKISPKNASVLEYEARYLVTFGLPSQAIQRIVLALKIDQQCVGCWQILYSLTKDTHTDKASWAKDGCIKNVGERACATKTKMPQIHPQYSLGVMKVFSPSVIL